MNKILISMVLILLGMFAMASAQPTLPDLSGQTYIADKGETLEITIQLEEGPDNGSVTWNTDMANLQLKSSDDTSAVYEWTGVSQSGTYQGNISASDLNSTDKEVLTVQVNNNAPVITSEPIRTAYYETAYEYNVEAQDDDTGDTLTYNLEQKPNGMQIDPASGVITFDVPQDYSDTTVEVNVTDGEDSTIQTYFLSGETLEMDITVDNLKFGGPNTQRQQTITKEVQITNNMDSPITNLGFDLSDILAEYEMHITSNPVPTSIDAGESVMVEFSMYIPQSVGASEYEAIGDLNISGEVLDTPVSSMHEVSVKAESLLQINSLTYTTGQDSPTSITQGSTATIKQGETITYEVEFENTDTSQDFENIASQVIIGTGLPGNLQQTLAYDAALEPGEQGTMQIQLSVPDDFETGNYESAFEVNGVLGGDKVHADIIEFETEITPKDPSEEMLDVSKVTIGDDNQEREENATDTLVIKNKAEFALQNVNIDLNTGNYDVSLVDEIPFTIGAGDEVSLQVEGYLPEDFDSGEHDIGSIEITGNYADGTSISKTSRLYMQAESNLEIQDIDITVNGDEDDLDDGDDVKVFPGSEIEMVIEVENTHRDIDIEDVEVLVISEDDEIDVDEDEDIGDIRDGDEETATISFTLDDDVDEDDYKIYITAEGEDENGALHKDEWVIEFELEADGILITSVRQYPSSITCDTDEVTLEIELENIGDSDEDEVAYEVIADSFDFERRESNFEIEEDEDVTKSVVIPIEDVDGGTYTVTINAFKDFDEKTDDKYVYLTLPFNCGPSDPGTGNGGDDDNGDDDGDQDSGTGDDVDDGLNEDDFIDYSEGDFSSDRDGSVYMTILLVLANVLVLMGIIVLIVKFIL